MHNQEKPAPPLCCRALGTFNAASFYSVLRANGCDPVVHNGALHMGLNEGSAAVIAVGQWAAHHDPTGAARLEFARAAWNSRSPRTEIVKLG